MAYKIGDVVRIVNQGGFYQTYCDAFDYFNITKNIEINSNFRTGSYYFWRKKLIIPKDFNEVNWVIVNMAIHCNGDTIVYHIMNARGDSIVCNRNSIMLRKNVETKLTKNLKDKNKNFYIEQIPSSYY